MSDVIKVEVDDGKYTVVLSNGRTKALRRGDCWRDCTGDNLIYWLAVELHEARSAVQEVSTDQKISGKLSLNLIDMLSNCNMSTRHDIEDYIIKLSKLAVKLERQLGTEQLNNKALQTECDNLAIEVQRIQEVASQVEDYAMERTEEFHRIQRLHSDLNMDFFKYRCLVEGRNWWQRLFKVGF